MTKKWEIVQHGDHIKLRFPESENWSCDGEWLDYQQLFELLKDLGDEWARIYELNYDKVGSVFEELEAE